MASRLIRKSVAQTLRPRAQPKPHGHATIPRRNMSSSSHEPKLKSDTPWVIGSSVVTVSGLAYLLTPPGKKNAHSVAAVHEGANERTAPSKVAENAEPEPPMKDDEGTEVSGEDVKASMDQEFKSDSPEDAKEDEEHDDAASKDDRFNDGAPGQTSAVHDEDKPEQKEKPGSKKRGTVQGESDEGPTNLGKAREKATQGKATPKEAKGGDDEPKDKETKEASDGDSEGKDAGKEPEGNDEEKK